MKCVSFIVRVTVGLSVAVQSLPMQAGEKVAQMPVFELRTYTTEPDKLPELHQRFRDHTMQLFQKHGMTNVIYWNPVDKPNTLVYFLSHASEAAGRKSFDGFRSDPAWQKAYAESRKNGPLVKKVESLYLTPTDYSPAKSAAEFAKLVQKQPGLVYELRTYTTNPDRLDALNSRFRDHTMRLFEKHGITNVLYTTPLDPQQKHNTLVYVIAHESAEAAQKSWQAFHADPEWQKVAAESQQDGAILVKGGVQRLYLKPTDYSPVK